MSQQQLLEKNWEEIKDRIKHSWGLITDADLEESEGNLQRLAGLIQKKTGRGMDEIEDTLERLIVEGSSAMDKVSATAQDYAQAGQHYAQQAASAVGEQYDQVAQAVGQQYQQVSGAVQSGLQEAEQLVRRNPTESVVVSFAAGLIAGVLVGVSMSRR